MLIFDISRPPPQRGGRVLPNPRQVEDNDGDPIQFSKRGPALEAAERAGLDAESVQPVMKPGIVTAFRPTAIEYVVKGDETEEELDALEARGIEPVIVERAEQLEVTT